jgi:hypothetical protein
MQVYLPDDLYELVKARGLPASALRQKAVRAELRRLDLLAETDRYLTDLVALTIGSFVALLGHPGRPPACLPSAPSCLYRPLDALLATMTLLIQLSTHALSASVNVPMTGIPPPQGWGMPSLV